MASIARKGSYQVVAKEQWLAEAGIAPDPAEYSMRPRARGRLD